LFAYANNNGGPFSWQAFASANVSGNSVTIPAVTSPPGETVDLTPGKTQLLFIGC
jgi:hypothetical protein